MTEYFHYDERVTDLHAKVYAMTREHLIVTGEPMRQGDLANKLREARAQIRNALIDLDKWGYVRFVRPKPQDTSVTDINRRLTIDQAKADTTGRISGAEPSPSPYPKTVAAKRKPTMRMPWEQ